VEHFVLDQLLSKLLQLSLLTQEVQVHSIIVGVNDQFSARKFLHEQVSLVEILDQHLKSLVTYLHIRIVCEDIVHENDVEGDFLCGVLFIELSDLFGNCQEVLFVASFALLETLFIHVLLSSQVKIEISLLDVRFKLVNLEQLLELLFDSHVVLGVDMWVQIILLKLSEIKEELLDLQV